MKTERRHPVLLFTRDRLDLAVKWRFFRHLQTGTDPEAERVYRWHIEARTGGQEPGSWKRTVDDYVRGAAALLVGMQDRGFDPLYPVRVGCDGRLKGGAHRTACALALGIHIHIRRVPTPSRAPPWGASWFVDKGVAWADLQRIQQDWDKVHRHDAARHLLHE